LGNIDYLNDDIRMALLSIGYTPNLNSDSYLSDVLSYLIGDSEQLNNKTIIDGAADCDDVLFGSVSSGNVIRYAVVYKNTGVASTSPLIVLLGDIPNVPFVSTGNDIEIVIDNGSNKLFRL
jgi:hypothetical protein